MKVTRADLRIYSFFFFFQFFALIVFFFLRHDKYVYFKNFFK